MSTETLPRDDTAIGLSTIEGIDLDLEPACEHSEHSRKHPGDEPAAYVVRAACPLCPWTVTYLLCAPGWAVMTDEVRCSQCEGVNPKREVITILTVL